MKIKKGKSWPFCSPAPSSSCLNMAGLRLKMVHLNEHGCQKWKWSWPAPGGCPRSGRAQRGSLSKWVSLLFLGSSAEISWTHWRNLALFKYLDLACRSFQAVGTAPELWARGMCSIVAGMSYLAPGIPVPAKVGRRRDEPKLQLGCTWPCCIFACFHWIHAL